MPKKILYIEDEEFLGTVITTKIASAGYEARHVTSVEEAEKLGDFSADLLLIDHGLPGKQGIDALPDLKKIFPQAKMVIFSNFDDENYTEKAKENGADDFWVKNESLKDITNKVNEILTS